MFQITEFRELTTVEKLFEMHRKYVSSGDLFESSRLADDILKIINDINPLFDQLDSFDDAAEWLERNREKLENDINE